MRHVLAPRAPVCRRLLAAPGAPRSGHVQNVSGGPAHVTTHSGKHAIVSGVAAYSKSYADT
eukprot:4855131-Pyramimonas_sp.AAC.1